MKKIVDTKEGMGKKMRDSSFALTEAKYAAGEFRHTVFDSVETVCTSAPFTFLQLIRDASQQPLQIPEPKAWDKHASIHIVCGSCVVVLVQWVLMAC